MPGPASSHGRWRRCSSPAAFWADWPARARRVTSRNAAARSTLYLRWSLLRWRSICWRVTYPCLERRYADAAAGPGISQLRDPVGINRTRRETLGLLGAGAALLGAGAMPRSALAQDDETVLTEALVLRDPEIPGAGNLDGDINIV